MEYFECQRVSKSPRRSVSARSPRRSTSRSARRTPSAKSPRRSTSKSFRKSASVRKSPSARKSASARSYRANSKSKSHHSKSHHFGRGYSDMGLGHFGRQDFLNLQSVMSNYPSSYDYKTPPPPTTGFGRSRFGSRSSSFRFGGRPKHHFGSRAYYR